MNALARFKIRTFTGYNNFVIQASSSNQARWHLSTHFVDVHRKFIPCFLKCLLQVRLHCVHSLCPVQSSCSHKSSQGLKSYYCVGHSITDKIPADGFFSKILCIVWSFVLGHLFVKGENCLQSSSIHRVRHDVAKHRSFLFCLRRLSHSLSLCLTDDVQPSSHSVFLLLQHRTNFLLSNANSLNLAPSVHNRCFIPSPVLCLCSFAHLNLFPLVPDVAFSFHFCLEARIVEFPLYSRC